MKILSLQYILHRMGKESFAIHTRYDELQTLPMPFIAHVTTNVDLFLFVDAVSAEEISILDEKGNVESIAKETFIKIWDGNVLVIDDKPAFVNVTLKERFDVFINKIRKPFFLSCLMLALVYALSLKQEHTLLFYGYLFGIIGGLITSIFLFVEQIDKHNLFIKKLCHVGGNRKSNVDCSSILDFKDAYFLGLISWSDIGFVYFTCLLALLLICPLNIAQGAITILSTLSTGYICYSLFYQKFIAKKWCTLCLSVQAVFMYLFITSLVFWDIDTISATIQAPALIKIGIIVLLVVSVYVMVKPLIQSKKDNTSIRRKLNEILSEGQIMQYLYSKEIAIEDWEQTYTLNIGSPEAQNQLNLLFSPVCVSCIKELQVLLPILSRKSEMNLNLLFLLDGKKYPESVKIAQWMIKQYMESPESFPIKLQHYVTNYPVSKNDILKRECRSLQNDNKINDILIQQEEWCIKHKLYSTPILFLNNRRVPVYYTVKDLDYLCY